MQDESVGQGKTRLFAQVRPRCAQPSFLVSWRVETGREKPANKYSYWDREDDKACHALPTVSVCLLDAAIPGSGFLDNLHRCLQSLT